MPTHYPRGRSGVTKNSYQLSAISYQTRNRTANGARAVGIPPFALIADS